MPSQYDLKLGRAGEAIRGGLLNFFEGGAPIRSGFAGLLRGDVEPLKQAVGYGQPFPQLTPNQMQQQAFDVAMDINNPMQNIGGILGVVKNAKIDDIETLRKLFRDAQIERRALKTPESIKKAEEAQKALQTAEMQSFNQRMSQSLSNQPNQPAGILDYQNPSLELTSLNPTGAGSKSGLSADYVPEIRAVQPLAANIASLDKTMGGSPDDIITIYRGAPKNQKKIVPGDFITDMKELAKAYSGDGHVISMKVRRGDILDDIKDPLGNEYLYRPNADKYR